jgi:hypothetical protein
MAVRGEKVGRRAKLDDTAATPDAHPRRRPGAPYHRSSREGQ